MGVALEIPFLPDTVGNQPLCTLGLDDRVCVVEFVAVVLLLSS
jgi:hypothetical protein